MPRANDWTVERVSDAEIFEEMRRVAQRLADVGVQLSGPLYDRNRKDGALTQIRIIQRFGTWMNACEAAGVIARPPAGRREYFKDWTEGEILDWVLKYLDHAGDDASYHSYERWALNLRVKGQHAPSGTSVRNHAPSRKWVEIRNAAIERRNSRG
jgi:hypothetical protein